MFMYLMTNVLSLNKEVIQEHVEHLKELDRQNKLFLCGPFTDYKGGMVILNVKDLEEAHNIAKADPFIASGCKTYEMRTLLPANKENNYLLEE